MLDLVPVRGPISCSSGQPLPEGEAGEGITEAGEIGQELLCVLGRI